MSQIDNRLTDVFRATFADESIELSPEMTADDIPAWDSIAHIQLIFAVEEEFGIKLTMQDLEALYDVGALQAAIARHLERSAAG
jgi:acyl carrier protein